MSGSALNAITRLQVNSLENTQGICFHVYSRCDAVSFMLNVKH